MAMAGICGKCREGCLLFFVVLVDEVRRGRRPKGDLNGTYLSAN